MPHPEQAERERKIKEAQAALNNVGQVHYDVMRGDKVRVYSKMYEFPDDATELDEDRWLLTLLSVGKGAGHTVLVIEGLREKFSGYVGTFEIHSQGVAVGPGSLDRVISEVVVVDTDNHNTIEAHKKKTFDYYHNEQDNGMNSEDGKAVSNYTDYREKKFICALDKGTAERIIQAFKAHRDEVAKQWALISPKIAQRPAKTSVQLQDNLTADEIAALEILKRDYPYQVLGSSSWISSIFSPLTGKCGDNCLSFVRKVVLEATNKEHDIISSPWLQLKGTIGGVPRKAVQESWVPTNCNMM